MGFCDGVSYAALLLHWSIRSALVTGRIIDVVNRIASSTIATTVLCSSTTGDSFSDDGAIQCDNPVSNSVIAAEDIPAEYLPSQKFFELLAPLSFWRPRDLRLAFGPAFAQYKGSVVRDTNSNWGMLWIAGDVLLLPTVVCVASTAKPTEATRWALCNGVMLAGSALLIVFAAALGYARPYRIGIRNFLGPLIVLWVALTCLLSCPLLTDRLTTAAEDARGIISALQSCTVLLLGLAELVVFLTVDRRMALREQKLLQGSGKRPEIQLGVDPLTHGTVSVSLWEQDASSHDDLKYLVDGEPVNHYRGTVGRVSPDRSVTSLWDVEVELTNLTAQRYDDDGASFVDCLQKERDDDDDDDSILMFGGADHGDQSDLERMYKAFM